MIILGIIIAIGIGVTVFICCFSKHKNRFGFFRSGQTIPYPATAPFRECFFFF